MRRGSTSTVRFRRAVMLLASAGGNSVPVIARLVQADEDTVRDVIHRFKEIGLACLDPRWAGGRPRLLTVDDEDFVIQTATTRPTSLGKPFTRGSIRKITDHLCRDHARPMRIGCEALRCLLARRGVTFQRAKTWKESTGPDFDAKLDRIEYALNERPDRAFGLRRVRPSGHPPDRWLLRGREGQAQPAAGDLPSHPRHHLLPRLLLGRRRHPLGRQPPPQGHREHSGGLKSIRAARLDGAPIYVILDNLSAHTGAKVRRWAAKSKAELCFTPTNASWANPIEAHFAPLRLFTLASSHHPNHTVQTRELHRYLRWRNTDACHPDVLAAQRRERARMRGEKGIRWGGRRPSIPS
ncbi:MULTISPECIES: IS630 family transposase [unclassified Streptomyces]|uniref:IS630 family transposase n=1 Tax=unclassified Streptomyces TaxID=2593676 RepID=UPI0035DD7E17